MSNVFVLFNFISIFLIILLTMESSHGQSHGESLGKCLGSHLHHYRRSWRHKGHEGHGHLTNTFGFSKKKSIYPDFIKNWVDNFLPEQDYHPHYEFKSYHHLSGGFNPSTSSYQSIGYAEYVRYNRFNPRLVKKIRQPIIINQPILTVKVPIYHYKKKTTITKEKPIVDDEKIIKKEMKETIDGQMKKEIDESIDAQQDPIFKKKNEMEKEKMVNIDGEKFFPIDGQKEIDMDNEIDDSFPSEDKDGADVHKIMKMNPMMNQMMNRMMTEENGEKMMVFVPATEDEINPNRVDQNFNQFLKGLSMFDAKKFKIGL